jgi:hypothetical protein
MQQPAVIRSPPFVIRPDGVIIPPPSHRFLPPVPVDRPASDYVLRANPLSRRRRSTARMSNVYPYTHYWELRDAAMVPFHREYVRLQLESAEAVGGAPAQPEPEEKKDGEEEEEEEEEDDVILDEDRTERKAEDDYHQGRVCYPNATMRDVVSYFNACSFPYDMFASFAYASKRSQQEETGIRDYFHLVLEWLTFLGSSKTDYRAKGFKEENTGLRTSYQLKPFKNAVLLSAFETHHTESYQHFMNDFERKEEERLATHTVWKKKQRAKLMQAERQKKKKKSKRRKIQ